jgi:hypothetical protein
MPSDPDPDVVVVLSLLRMGNKYSINRLRRTAIAMLHQFFPTTLANWDQVYLAQDFDHDSFEPDHDLLALLEIALDLDLEFLVPAICLRICMLMNLNTICDCVERQDLVIRLVKGRAAIIDQIRSTLYSWIPVRHDHGPGSDPCSQCSPLFLEGERQAIKPLSGLLRPKHLLGLGQALPPLDFCHSCRLACDHDYPQCRETFWSRLPDYFHCAPWAALEDGYHRGQITALRVMRISPDAATELREDSDLATR